MKEIKQEKLARILPLHKKEIDEFDQNVSEMTRTLFSDAWHNYLDQTSMAAIKLESFSTPEVDTGLVERPKLTII